MPRLSVTGRPVLDVSDLPHVVFGYRSLIWWGTLGLVVIEGMVFALTISAYFYLRTRTNDWPPGINPPRLLPGTVSLVLIILSSLPNVWLQKAATKYELSKVRLGLCLMSAVAAITLVIRIFEFPALQAHWNANAYASAAWVLLGFHTVHLLTDAYDTWVLTAMFFIGPVQGKRFMDVAENSDYWWFVVLTWIPVYFVIYWAPRLL